MADVVEVLQLQGGTANYAQLRGSVSGRSVRTALAAERIRRIAKGVYALPLQADPLIAARAQGGVLSHESAAILHGFDVLALPTTPQVTVRRGQHRRKSSLRCTLHWADDVSTIDGVTTGLRTVLDCARSLELAGALTVADSALRLGTVQHDDLSRAAAELRGPGCRRARAVVEAADA